MTHFSWSDSLQIAFSSCLPCLVSRKDSTSGSTDSLIVDEDRYNPTAHRIPRASADELHGLLQDPETTDGEAERMSLHSNPGLNKKRTRRPKKKKKTTIFGYDLFGRRLAPPPIHLPESDDDSGHVVASSLTRQSSSSMTFDSDAAPIDSALIDSMTVSTSSAAMARELAAREAREEEEKRLKAERRAKRRERKEMRRLAKALEEESQMHVEEAFEGFQGSSGGGGGGKDGYPGIPSFEEYGPFMQAQQEVKTHTYDDGGDDDDADLDGQVYARRSGGGGGSRSGSDSRSRTSATSRSDVPPSPAFQPLSPPPQSSGLAPGMPRQTIKQVHPKSSKSKKNNKSSSSTTTSRSNTSASTSQSPSLPSPTSTAFGFLPQNVPMLKNTTSTGIDNHHHHHQFDGSQGLTEADVPSPGPGTINKDDNYTKPLAVNGIHRDLPSPGLRIDKFPSPGLQRGDFPSPGFGRPHRSGSILAKGGAFLATRGDSGESR